MRLTFPERHTETQGEDRGRDGSGAATSHGACGARRSWKSHGRDGSCLKLLEESGWVLSLWKWVAVNFFFFFEAKTSWWQFVTEVLGQEFKLYMHLELSPHKHPDR
jgi:hypothetical protein